ncbi:ribose-phosphate pyrophosphokinase 4-like [Senna tora]|uniref:Ribose-phosphate pyrophosphokinase 4-like n=1 Tax=Senna tora TaxID=362788 RepID=A0A834W9Z3_9FABA|nr:ribose-phosphate pyrophosphokinase 4-like [Senna tora]
MAAPSPSFSLSPNPTLTNFSKSLNSSLSFFLPTPLKSYFNSTSEIRCFEPHHSWTIDHVSEMNDSIHTTSSLLSVSAANAATQFPTNNSKKVSLFYCDETKTLAQKIAAQTDTIELRNINWGKFPDGFPNIFIPNAQGIRGQHVAFLASFSSPAVIFEQIPVIYALPKLFIASFTLVLPFFPTGTSERMEDEGDVATAFTLARLLSNIPISRGGPTSLVTFDIHALQERFYFGDNILPCFESGIPLLKRRLQELPDSDNISIAFPDDGAWKRFHKQLQHFPTIVCAKVREGDQRIVRIKEGDPRDRHIVIVDDLVQSGGTLIECQKVLAAHGAKKISAYVTHGIFPNKSWARFQQDNGVMAVNCDVLNSNYNFSTSTTERPLLYGEQKTPLEAIRHPDTAFTYFWITDSCPLTVKEVMNKPPFEVLSLAGSIAASLQI